MKNAKWIVLMSLAWLLYACQDEQPVVENGVVEFTFTQSAGSKNGRVAATLPPGTLLRISISKSDGTVVHLLKELRLLKIGDSYLSEPLVIPAGNYRILDYLIVAPGNQILYAAPHTGSPFAKLVNTPLPILFRVADNQTSNTSVEVVDASAAEPEDFGYASFGVDIVPNSIFSVSVFKPLAGSGLENTSAQAYVLQDSDTVLAREVHFNTGLYWDIEPGQQYKLVIIKHGYGRYEKWFTRESIVSELNGAPLVAVLNKAFTFSFTPESGPGTVYFFMKATQTSLAQPILVDWGDGRIDGFPYPFEMEFQHQYASRKKYFISVYGSVELIESFSTAYQIGVIDTISIVHLPALKSFQMALFQYAGTGIDFSKNPELQMLGLSYTNLGLRELDISHNPLLNTVDIQATQFSTAVIDKFIDDLYGFAISQNRRGGIINISDGLHPNDPNAMVGPPSPDRIARIHTLIDDYGWLIYPVSPH
jgi:hypothetical protein